MRAMEEIRNPSTSGPGQVAGVQHPDGELGANKAGKSRITARGGVAMLGTRYAVLLFVLLAGCATPEETAARREQEQARLAAQQAAHERLIASGCSINADPTASQKERLTSATA